MTDMKTKTTLYLEGYYVSTIGYDYSLSLENLTEEQVNLIKEKQEDMSTHSFLDWLKDNFERDKGHNYNYDEEGDQEFEREYDVEPEVVFHELIKLTPMKNNQDPTERLQMAMELCKILIFTSEGIDPNISDEYEFTYNHITKVVMEIDWWEDKERTIGHNIQVRYDLRDKLGMLIFNNIPENTITTES